MIKYFLILFVGLFASVNAQSNDEQPTTDLIIPVILDQYKDSLEQKRFGIGALIRHNGKTETYALGIAGDSIEMTPDRVFNIGSLTKTFTAVLIMQEVEKGTLLLSDPISDYFAKDLIKNKNVDLTITIEQLLRHESGLGEVVTAQNLNRSLFIPFDEYQYSNLFKKIPKAINKPKSPYKYTNTNYILLGYILELVNNSLYQDLVKDRIFEPAGMLDSHGYYSPTIKNAAHPMNNGVDHYSNTSFYSYKNLAYSAGGLASTLEDLESFFENLFEKETLVKKETLDQMTNTDSGYGLGIQIFKFGEEKKIILGHGGDNFSFKTRDYYNPETGDLVIVFSNQMKDPFTQVIADELLRTLAKLNKQK